MAEFIQQYLGSILVGAGVLAVIVLIIAVAVRDKRAGRSSCGGDCAHCGGCRHSEIGDKEFLHHSNIK